MAWNRPNAETSKGKKSVKNTNGLLTLPLCGISIVAVLVVGVWFFTHTDDGKESAQDRAVRSRIAFHKVNRDCPPNNATNSSTRVSKIREELNQRVKDFVTKSPTNVLHFLGELPLDPNDPDNAMRTQAARDIATILSIKPGENVPECIPMGFMFEDDAIATAELEGQKIITVDGGNKDFLDSLKKWKVTIKESDSDAVATHKEKLVDAQLEILDGIKDGISVNDAIRAAYEFRVRAAEARRSMVEMITEMRNDPNTAPDEAETLAMIKKCNEKLAEEGIIAIDPVEIIEDYNPPETD